MREKYWNFYYKIAYQFCYYKNFQHFFTGINWAITVFCTITSLSSIAAWGIWKTHPLIWSILICISQLIQAVFPKLPYNDLLCSTKFMICSLEKLRMAIDHSWLEIDFYGYNDEEILNLLEKYEVQYSELVSQFFAGTYLPVIKHCDKKAEEECTAYFNAKYSS